jgi:hypothetical protein
MADALHRHSELSASDGTPNQALIVDASGNIGINEATPSVLLTIKNSGNDSAVLGSELLTNGTFDSDLSSWTAGANWAWEGSGTAEHTSGSTETIKQGVSLTNTEIYQVQFTTSGRTAGTLTLTFGALAGSEIASGNATYTASFQATSTTSFDLTFTPTSTWDGKIDNITVKEITDYSDTVLLLKNNDDTDAVEFRSGGDASNFFLGRNVGRNILSGSTNVAIGIDAFINNTNGYGNVAIGNLSLQSNLDGYYNVAIGKDALLNNIFGFNNLGLGHNALTTNTLGWNNTGLGNAALGLNTIGYDNVAVGISALFSNVSGVRGVGIGVLALYYSTTTHYNIGIGYRAGMFLSDGSSENQTPTQCIYIGRNAKASTAGRTNEVVIGYNAIGSGSNTITLGGSTTVDTIIEYGNLGVGISSPDTILEVETASDLGKQAVTIDQNDADQAFIDYQGTTAANADNSVSSWTTGASIQGFIRVEINGTTRWMPFYDAPTS